MPIPFFRYSMYRCGVLPYPYDPRVTPPDLAFTVSNNLRWVFRVTFVSQRNKSAIDGAIEMVHCGLAHRLIWITTPTEHRGRIGVVEEAAMGSVSFRPQGRPVPSRRGSPRKEPPRTRRRVGSVAALYAHALAIEQESVSQYRDFAQRMSDLGNDVVAELFLRLAEFECEHAFRLAKKTEGMQLPKLLPGEYAWLDSGAPLPEARAFVYRLMTPRNALEIALAAEERAKAFFDSLDTESCDRSFRALVAEFSREEQAHIAWVQDAMDRLPRPFTPTEDDPGDPTIPQDL